MDERQDGRNVKIATLGQIGLQQFAPYLMNRIMGRYNATLRQGLRNHDLTVPQVRALAVLAVGDGMSINELSVYTVIEQSTMSRTLDAMETQGLVRREACQDDSRTRNIYLTDKGREEFNRVWPAMHEAFSEMFTDVDEAEYATFIATLQKILGNIRKHDF
ncbi:MarR family winged helix-turn-helix transcriptional regulator [Nitratireductor sp. GISD-1A_MAKvit]|uniref:MarR family winged helix-turn-helix transcriptional regulator n=1 Tax=Nitratireductor sp. GISD-1A_MAKvit TaxID=3234198 RepID=UPI003466CAAF